MLALNCRYEKSSEYLNCLHFGTYLQRLNSETRSKQSNGDSSLETLLAN